MKNLSHGTPCAVKAACTVWTGAKGSKESDLSVFLFRYEYSANSSTSCGSASASTTDLWPGWRRMWTNCCAPTRPAWCWLTQSFSWCWTRAPPTARNWRSCWTFPTTSLAMSPTFLQAVDWFAARAISYLSQIPSRRIQSSINWCRPTRPRKRSKSLHYKNRGPPKRSEGVLQTWIRRYDISFSSSLGGRT